MTSWHMIAVVLIGTAVVATYLTYGEHGISVSAP